MTEATGVPPTVLVIAAPGLLDELPAALSAEGIASETVSSAAAVEAFISEHPQTIAVLDADMPQMDAFGVYKILRQNEGIPTLIVVPAETYRTFLLDPLRGPNEDYVAKPVQVDELILRVKALMLRSGIRPPTSAAGKGAGDEQGSSDTPGKIVTVFHAKGGVGASTVATNLAVGLARFRQLRVLLVDADMWFGDLAVLMNVPARESLFERLATGEFEPSDLRRALYHHPSGISILVRPEDPSVAERLDPALVAKVIAGCRATFDFVIVDASPTLSEMILQILDLSSQIILVTTPELTAVHNSARFLKIADAIGYANRVSLVLNRANSGIPTELLEQHLNISAQVHLPSAGRLMVDAANRGEPLLASLAGDQGDELIQRLMGLVEIVVPSPAGSKPVAASAPPAPEPRPRSGRFFWK